MQLISFVWRIGMPVVMVAAGTFLLVGVIRSREKAAPMSRRRAVVILLLWLILAGDALFGEQRPDFERRWKGAAALLLAMTAAVHLWNRYRRRDHTAPAPKDQASLAASATPYSSSAVLVTMPALGEDVTEGTVTRWLKQVGDRVEAGEPLVEISTGKADVEIPAYASGELLEIRVSAGRDTSVGATIAVIEPRR